MRGVRSLLVLLVLAIALGWLAYRDYQRPAGQDGPAREDVFAVEADSIDAITVRSASGERTELRKTGEQGWQIVQPVAAQPDPSEISGLTTNLANLEVQRVVDENPASLDEYGLATPRIEVAFTGGGSEHRLLIGNKTPPETDLYAKRGSDARVFLIPAHLESTFNRTTFELRDKSVLKVDREKLETVEIASGARTLRFTRRDGEWQMTAPVQARADYSAVEGVVSRVTGLQMKSIVDGADGAAAKFGLEKPAATVRLGTGSSQASLALGSPAGEGAVYARDLSRPLVFTVDASLLAELEKGAAAYRQTDLVDARSFNMTKLEITRGGQTHVFEKGRTKNKEGQDQETWRQTSPQARELDQATVEPLLSAATTVRATDFVESPAATRALAEPELTLTITSDEGRKQERVVFGRAGDAAFASRAGEPGAARVEGSAIDALVKALGEIK